MLAAVSKVDEHLIAIADLVRKAAFSVGDRAKVRPGKEHMDSHKGAPGTVKIVQPGAIGILFDGTKSVHKWYTPKELEKIITKGLITAPDLSNGGKKKPATAGGKLAPKAEEKCACGKAATEQAKCTKGASCEMKKQPTMKAFVEIAKANDEEQTVSGIVLKPEVTDAQGDIYSAEVIRESAFDFLANYNKSTKLGHQHKDFKNWAARFALVESYVAPCDFVLGDKTVKMGSWVMTVKVLDSKIWKMVKDGKITGFSIGGKATVQKLNDA